MLSVASSAGIDVGKQYLDVGFFPAAKPLRVVNEPTGIAKIRVVGWANRIRTKACTLYASVTGANSRAAEFGFMRGLAG